LITLFQNLIANAIKFRGSTAPSVCISCTEAQGDLVFSIRDNGIGFDPKFSDRIFNIFDRLHTFSEYPGTGMGLAICKKIVERHGGKIWAEGSPGRGATLSFSLPAPPVEAADRRDDEPPVLSTAGSMR
jgi:chemotaxis family two-component system sensor kinase Cph1